MMKYWLLLLLLNLTVSATDQWETRWNARVEEADNQDAKARDMASDWFFDHRTALQHNDPKTLQESKRITDWMAAHQIPLPSKVVAMLTTPKPAPAVRVVAEDVPDDTYQGDLLPRSTTELHRQQVDDLRHYASHSTHSLAPAEIIDLGNSP